MNAEVCEIEPINNQIIFRFIEDTTKGRFNQQTGSGVIVVDHKDKQVDYARWVRVLGLGPTVSGDYSVGDIILVTALQWTPAFHYDTKPHWITTDNAILAVLPDESNPPAEIKHFLNRE